MARFGIGQPVRRAEDSRFLTGTGRYVDDVVLPRMVFAAVVYAPHAHADITAIDTNEALGMPGVLAVLTGAEAEQDGIGGLPPYFMPSDTGGPPGYRTLRPVLVRDRVRCVGDRVAVVIAESPDRARDAADTIAVSYQTLPCVISPERAAEPGAPSIWPDCPSNRCFTLAFGDVDATAAALAAAAHVISLDIRNSRVCASAIEPRSAIGAYDASSGRYTLHASSQNPHGVRHTLAAAVFHVPEQRVHVISPDVGGGFGMKADPYPEDAIVLWAARRLGRPVKWVGTRSESMMGDLHGRDQFARCELGLDGDGRALALRVRAFQGLGAYIASAAVAPIFFSLRMLPGVYDFPSSTCRIRRCSPIARPPDPIAALAGRRRA